MKFCPKCKQTKDESEFQVCRINKTGLQCYCRSCRSRQVKFFWLQKDIGENEKQCLKCRTVKPKSEFRKDASKKDLLHPFCKTCKAKQDREYSDRNKDKIKEYRKRTVEITRERRRIQRIPVAEQLNAKKREWNKKNKELIRAYAREYSKREPQEKKRARSKRNWTRNREKILSRMRDKYYSDPMFRLTTIMRANIHSRLKHNTSTAHYFDILGYSPEDLLRYIEKKMLPGMSWENYGRDWEIDHKIPVAAFNFQTTNDIDFKRCWALKNLRPLWKFENRSKSDNVEKPFQPCLAISL